jgi:hypothetical protein
VSDNTHFIGRGPKRCARFGLDRTLRSSLIPVQLSATKGGC